MRLKKSKKPYRVYHAATPYLFLLPALIVFLIFSILPILYAFYLSFTNYSMFNSPEWVGLANYKKLLSDQTFYKSVWNAIRFWLSTTPFLVVLPIIVAILVNQKIRGINFFRTVYYFPVVVSSVICATMWKWVLQENGFFNALLIKLNILSEPISWLSNSRTSIWSLALITIWQGIGYYMVIYLAGLQAIPNDLYEAATIDGAGLIQKHLRITFPLLLPSISIVAVMSTISALKLFDLVFVIYKGSPPGEVKPVIVYLYEHFISLRMGYASAIGVAVFFLLLIVSIINVKLTTQKNET